MNGKIYMLTNTKNNMKYIGQTFQEVNVRIRQGYAPSTQIGTAIQTYGIENFTFQILKTGITTQEKLNEWENYYIGHYRTITNGYNEKLA